MILDVIQEVLPQEEVLHQEEDHIVQREIITKIDIQKIIIKIIQKNTKTILLKICMEI